MIASDFASDLISEARAGGRASRARVHIKLLSEPARLILSPHVGEKVLKRGTLSLIKEFVNMLPRRAADLEQLTWRNKLIYKKEKEEFIKTSKNYSKTINKMKVGDIRQELTTVHLSNEGTKPILVTRLAQYKHTKSIFSKREEFLMVENKIKKELMHGPAQKYV